MPNEAPRKPALLDVEPQLFVTDIRASVAWFESKLGFAAVFVHGEPPFYAQVRRDDVKLNLRQVDAPLVAADLLDREQYLACSVAVADAAGLFAQFTAAGADFQQTLQRKPWGARDFVMRDPDGNLILFAGA